MGVFTELSLESVINSKILCVSYPHHPTWRSPPDRVITAGGFIQSPGFHGKQTSRDLVPTSVSHCACARMSRGFDSARNGATQTSAHLFPLGSVFLARYRIETWRVRLRHVFSFFVFQYYYYSLSVR
jgi:hypothetical protein